MTTATIQAASRVFKLNSLELPDPDPKLPPEEAVQLYAHAYPQVGGAVLTGPEIDSDGRMVYSVERAPAKTKG